jgi:hypothetical protein
MGGTEGVETPVTSCGKKFVVVIHGDGWLDIHT